VNDAIPGQVIDSPSATHLPFAMAPRKSAFDLVLPIFDSSSSIASTGDSGPHRISTTSRDSNSPGIGISLLSQLSM